jgi:hypothetical protein
MRFIVSAHTRLRVKGAPSEVWRADDNYSAIHDWYSVFAPQHHIASIVLWVLHLYGVRWLSERT